MALGVAAARAPDASAPCQGQWREARQRMYGVSLAPGEAQFLVDDGCLDESTDEQELLLWRRSTRLEDVAEDGVPYGSTVIGIDGGGWLQVGDRYLPMRLGGAPVLTLLRRRDGPSASPEPQAAQAGGAREVPAAMPASVDAVLGASSAQGSGDASAWEAGAFRSAERRRRQEAGERWLAQRERLARLLGAAWRRHRRRRDARQALAYRSARANRQKASKHAAAAVIQRAWRRKRIALLRARQGRPWLQSGAGDHGEIETALARPVVAGGARLWNITEAVAAAAVANFAEETAAAAVGSMTAAAQRSPSPEEDFPSAAFITQLCEPFVAKEFTTTPKVVAPVDGDASVASSAADEGRASDCVDRVSCSGPGADAAAAAQEQGEETHEAASPSRTLLPARTPSLEHLETPSEDAQSECNRSEASTPRSAINEAISIASTEELCDPEDLPPVPSGGAAAAEQPPEATCLLPPVPIHGISQQELGLRFPAWWPRHSRRVLWTKPVMSSQSGAFRHPIDLKAAHEIVRPRRRAGTGRSPQQAQRDLLKEDALPMGLLPQMKIPGRYALSMREPKDVRRLRLPPI